MATSCVTGIGRGNNGWEAAHQAAKEAFEKMEGDRVDFAMVFSSLEYHLDDVYNGVVDAVGEVPIAGASSSGEFTEREASSKSVSVMLINSDTHTFYMGSAGGLRDNTEEEVKNCFNQLPAEIEDHPHRTVMLLHDGLIGRGEKILKMLDPLVGTDTTMCGGAAGDDLQFQASYVMHNNQVLSGGMVLVLIASKKQPGLGVDHGHEPVSEELEVTKAKENVLYEVNGRPAWEVWREQIKDIVEKEEGIDVYALEDPSEIGALLIKYEMGLSVGSGRYKVRVPLSVNKEDGSLNFAVEIFEGARFHIMQSSQEKQIDAAKRAAEAAQERVQGEVSGAIVFDCVCRGLILKENFKDAVQQMNHVIGESTPMIGFETYGEICKPKPDYFSEFHNTTTVVLLLPD